ncbi:MAG: nickel-responsive transcriptional regulator NikR [Smithellaceae bacterium]
MSKLLRFGVSMEEELLQKFDNLISRRKYTNRSEALRDMVRQELLKQEWEAGGEVAGAITYIYDHHTRELLGKITDIQHDNQAVIISSQHIHIDHHNCLEIITVKGRTKEITKLSDSLKAIKGVRHCALSIAEMEYTIA